MSRVFVLRIALASALLLGGWISLYAFEAHVKAPGPLPSVNLKQPLSELPLQLGEWKGADRPIDDPKTLYADQHLQRLYVNTKTRQQVLVWLAYSQQGEDRGHHPEVCMAVAGRPEDAEGRGTVTAPGHKAPIQQYRFGAPGNQQWVFYWHYTLLPSKGEATSDLQRFYQRLHRRPSSVTLELFAPEERPGDGDGAREFTLLLDAAIQSHLSDNAVRGSQRLPVTILRAETPRTLPTTPPAAN